HVNSSDRRQTKVELARPGTIRVLPGVLVVIRAIEQREDLSRTDGDRIPQVDIDAAQVRLEEIGIGLADGYDVAVRIASNEARELRRRLRVLQDSRGGKTAHRDFIAQVNPVGIEIEGKVLDRRQHRTQREGFRFLRLQVRVAAQDGRELEAARGVVRVERRSL